MTINSRVELLDKLGQLKKRKKKSALLLWYVLKFRLAFNLSNEEH